MTNGMNLLKNSIQILIWTLIYNSVLFVSYEAVPHPDKNRLVVLEAKVSLFKKITFGVIREVDTHAIKDRNVDYYINNGKFSIRFDRAIYSKIKYCNNRKFIIV